MKTINNKEKTVKLSFNSVYKNVSSKLDYKTTSELIKFYYDKNIKEVSVKELNKWEIIFLGSDLHEDVRFGEWHEFGWDPGDSLTFTNYEIINITQNLALIYFDDENVKRMIEKRGYNAEEVLKLNEFNMHELCDLL